MDRTEFTRPPGNRGLADLGSPPGGLYNRPAQTLSHGGTIHEGQSRSYKLLKAKTKKSHNFPSAAFYWPKQLSRLAQNQGRGKNLLLVKSTCKNLRPFKIS